MSCVRPIPAGVTKEGQVLLWRRGDTYNLELPCGKCVGCKMERRRMWALRIEHEASLYDVNWFLTLTYDSEKIWELYREGRYRSAVVDASLQYEDFQLFIKRLRKKKKWVVSRCPDGRKAIRFFCAGEYGGLTKRPHFHAILFNIDFPDRREFINGTYSSTLVEDLWGKGNVVIGSVCAQSAAYVAGYTLKKVHGADAVDHYEDVVNVATGESSSRRPEFVVMSRKPGIGTWWYEKYKNDLFPLDHAVSDGRCYKVPTFYWKKYKSEADPRLVEEVAYGRYLRAASQLEESTAERRAVREEVMKARNDLFSERGL